MFRPQRAEPPLEAAGSVGIEARGVHGGGRHGGTGGVGAVAIQLANTTVDLVLDTQGGATLQASLGVLRPGGTAIGITGPPDPAFARRVGVNPVVRLAIRALSARTRRRARALGVTYRFLFITPDGTALRRVADIIDGGGLRPVIDRVLHFDRTPRALAGGTRGKVLVTTDPKSVTNHG